MKKLIIVLLVLVTKANAQTNEDIARVFFQKAVEAFESKDYNGCLDNLAKADDKMGNSHPPKILYLQIKSSYQLAKTNSNQQNWNSVLEMCKTLFKKVNKSTYPAEKYNEIVEIHMEAIKKVDDFKKIEEEKLEKAKKVEAVNLEQAMIAKKVKAAIILEKEVLATGNNTVVIGKQTWMQTNLDVDHYRNGDVIPQIENPKKWEKLTSGAWCYYENKTENGVIYGKLYNWYAVNDSRGLAPAGWHMPSDAEWTTLIDFLGGGEVAGGKMKASSGWNEDVSLADNKCGFIVLPGGWRNYFGKFDGISYFGFWWSSTQSDKVNAWNRSMYYSAGGTYRNESNKKEGSSVRCIRD